jgi:T5orf172 domain
MSLSDGHRRNYLVAGYVYIAGSISGRVLKIGATSDVSRQQYKLQYNQYGGFDDWQILCHVWIDECRGDVEFAVRRRLQPYKTMGTYWKDRQQQKAREMVACSFSTAYEALCYSITATQKSTRWLRYDTHLYEF